MAPARRSPRRSRRAPRGQAAPFPWRCCWHSSRPSCAPSASASLHRACRRPVPSPPMRPGACTRGPASSWAGVTTSPQRSLRPSSWSSSASRSPRRSIRVVRVSRKPAVAMGARWRGGHLRLRHPGRPGVRTAGLGPGRVRNHRVHVRGTPGDHRCPRRVGRAGVVAGREDDRGGVPSGARGRDRPGRRPPRGARSRRARPRRARAQRHGPLLRRLDSRLRAARSRLGPVLRLSLRAPPDPLRRRRPPRAAHRHLDRLRGHPHDQAPEGHAHWAGRAEYLAWATRAFRLASSAALPATQVHTHMCYAELADVVDVLAELDFDVASFEAARSATALLPGARQHGRSRPPGSSRAGRRDAAARVGGGRRQGNARRRGPSVTGLAVCSVRVAGPAAHVRELGTAHRQGARSVHQLEILPDPTNRLQRGKPLADVAEAPAHLPRPRGGRGAALLGVDRRARRRRRRARVGAARRPGARRCLGLALTDRGTVAVDAGWETDVEGVFACGDAVKGQSLVVRAIAEGRVAAAAVDRRLMGTSDLPAPVVPGQLPLR